MRPSFQWKIRTCLITLTLLFAIGGCLSLNKLLKPAPEKKSERPREPSYFLHKVRWPGESLSIIAKWYTGRLENWRALTKANPKINPGRMKIGRKVRIPETLMRTREPLPKEFVALHFPKPKKKPKPSRPSPSKKVEEELELFGPKRFLQK